jgi:hypothetical protein
VNQGKLIAAALVIEAIQSGSLRISNDQKQSAIREIETELFDPAGASLSRCTRTWW